MSDKTTDPMQADPADPTQPDILQEMAGWSRETAAHQAKQEGIEMTDVHWKVIDFLQDYHRQNGTAANGPDVAKALAKAFSEHGGSAYLHQLFPEGPVAQGSRIAGLPVPPGSVDQSFGSAM